METASPRRETVEQLAEEFVARYRRGERPPLSEYTERHPEHAEQIRDLFPALVMMEQIAPGSQSDLLPDSDRWPRQRSGEHPERIGDYRLLREIGRGGMGVVYEAEQVSLGRRVALKVLPWPATRDRTTLERFRRKARASARLHHTNIVPVFEVGQDGEVRYYAMQFIQGQNLDAVLDELRRLRSRSGRERGPGPARADLEQTRRAESGTRGAAVELGVAQSLLTGRFERGPTVAPATGVPTASPDDPVAVEPVPAIAPDNSAVMPGGAQLSTVESQHRAFHRAVAHIGRQAASALAHAHARGIVHRDIKPSNLLLDTEGLVWVSDFGLASVNDDDALTRTGDVLGTLRYLAPERFRGRGDARADIYSLGLTLYELLLLRPAFDSPDRVALSEQIKTIDPPRPRSIDPRIPRDLETIVLKTIEKDPRARYASADAMAEDLRRFLDDEPILARRTGPIERAWRWSRRHQAVASLLAALAVVLVAGFSGMVILWARAEQNAAVARANEEKSNSLARTEAEARTEAQLQATIADDHAEALAREDYINRVNRAFREVQDDNVALAEDLLHGCPPERRGWEWHYVERLCHSERLSLDTGIATNTVAFSPDGSWFVSGSGTPTYGAWSNETDATSVDVCEGVTGRRRWALGALQGRVYAVAVSPDGRRVAVGSGFLNPKREARVSIWDAATGQPLWSWREAGLQPMTVAYSPDGRSLAVGYGLYSSDQVGRVKVWDALSGREVMALPGPRGGVNKLAYHPEGKLLAVAGAGTVAVWDLAARTKVRNLGGHTRWVYAVAFSPDGRWLATGGWDRRFKLWKAATGAEKLSVFGHDGFVLDLAFSPDSRHLATTGEDRSIKLWEVPTGRKLATFHGHTDFVQAIAFRPDGREIATGGADGSVKVWDLRASRPVVFDQHTGWVEHVAFRRDGRRVLSEAGKYKREEETTWGWDPLSGEPDPALAGVARDDPRFGFVPASGFRETAVKSPDGKWIAQINKPYGIPETSRSKNYERSAVAIHEAATGRVIRTLVGHSADATGAAFSPDGRRVATSSRDKTIKLWDTATGQDVFTLRGHTAGVLSLAFSPDGNLLVSGGVDNTARVWNATPFPAAVAHEHDARYLRKLATLAELKDPAAGARRAEVLARDGQWGLAADAFRRAIERAPEDLQLRYHHLLAVLKGDLAGYQGAVEELVARFGQTTAAPDLNLVAWSCTLAPTAVADRGAPVRIAEAALSAAPADRRPDVLTTLGAALYRAGRFDEAIRRLEESVQARGGSASPQASAFLAMALHRREDHAAARRWLEALRAYNPASDSRFSWEDVEIGILRREAEELVRSRDADPESLR